MKNLLHFFYRYHYPIFFILLEVFSLMLLVQYNSYQHSSFLNSSNKIVGKTYNVVYGVKQYFGLREKNMELNAAIARHLDFDKEMYWKYKVTATEVYDSVYLQQYKMIPAEIINSSVNRQNNFITINAGKKQMVDRGMAVVNSWGVIGIVKDASDNFASVISLLNQNLRISAMIKRNHFYGSLVWDGQDYRYATLIDLPNHITVIPGDTIITSGFSSMFPKGEIIGFVNHVYDRRDGDFLRIKVKLAVDFKKASNVIVIENLLKEEQIKLEGSTTDD